jgi:hypothetical protein
MRVKSKIEGEDTAAEEEPTGQDLLLPLMIGKTANGVGANSFPAVVIGELIAIRDESGTPLVIFPGQVGSAAVAARSVVDLQGAFIGRQVALMFDNADAIKPIIIGVLRGGQVCPLDQKSGQVEIDADGERLVVSAAKELVLRCGRASITLSKAGKVVIRGTYISTTSAGVNRIKGGLVQIN